MPPELLYFALLAASPSTRREWIEMRSNLGNIETGKGLPPHGGSGLKFLRLQAMRQFRPGLPPHGGSGLK